MDEMEEIIKEFLVESNDNLDQMDRDLVELEKDPDSKELLGRIFRAIHTVKGTSGVLGFGKLESVAHVGENLLSRMRDGKMRLNAEITTALLAMVDAIREVLRSLEASGVEGDGDYSSLIARLKTLLEKHAASEARSMGDILMDAAGVKPEAIVAALHEQETGDLRKLGEILVDHGDVQPAAVLEALKTQQAEGGSQLTASNIRVDVNLLDKLMNLVGELVLARNQVLQFTATQQDSNFQSTAQRLNLITTELQEGVMKTRMQPIGNIWSKFPRVVRDLATQFGKQVRIEMEGRDTELDKTIIEAIKDPLTHILRNSVDHGMELPAERIALGKAPEGVLTLRAFHEGGQVNIEILDDGRGIDVDRVKQKAVERGVVSSSQLAGMSEREALNLIFLPGLSTAKQVTNVSGRGVGMDVVKTNIEKIGGTVDVHSVRGAGTTLKIKIPLTLAIIPALIATTGGERFAIPQVSLLELVRLEEGQAENRIEMIHGAPVYRLRGKLLPLVYLSHTLGLQTGSVGSENLNSETVEFDNAQARASHLEWNDKLRKYLNGEISLTQQDAGNGRTCALGKWLYGTALERYSYIPEIRQLEKEHSRFHEVVLDFMTAGNSGNRPLAEAKLLEVQRLSHEVVDLLVGIEHRAKERTATNIVVLQADDRHFGLVVDEINDTEEIVVKPLGKQFKGISCFAGATIMGDGHVALILDVLGIAQMSNVVTQVRERALMEHASRLNDSVVGRNAWLVFIVAGSHRMAIPLSMISRLEEFPAKMLEESGEARVVQYRGHIMPLVDIASELNLGRMGPDLETLQVIVYSESGTSIGLIVDQIVDVVDQAVSVEQAKATGGLLGTAVIQERVTDLLNVSALMKQFLPTEVQP